MTNLSRITAKIFGETATATGDDPEIGQFGSALAGTYVGTTDVATIQSLPAWSNGFIDSVTPSTQFPPLPEMTGFGKVLSYQTAYTMQKGVPEWDASTVYYTGDFCKGVGEGKLYVSKVDSNINHAVTNSDYWEEFSSGAFRNIGEIVTSTIPLTDAGLHLLDGALLQYGSYQAFIDYIADLYDSGDYPDLFCTEAQWQTSVTQYGACDKYVYDSVNNTVRIPKRNSEHGDLIKSYKSGTDWYRIYSDGWCEQGGKADGATLGNAGTVNTINLLVDFANANYSVLMNGQNRLAGDASYYTLTLSTDKFTFTWGGYLSTSKCDYVVWRACGYIDISDYQYSPIYEYLVIANSTKTQIQVDIDEIATDLNGKMDTDGTNAVSSVKFADGQWVGSNLTLINTDTSITSGTTSTFSLSSYLPNDGYKYEVMFSVIGCTAATSGNTFKLCVGSSIIDVNNNIVAAAIARSNATYWCANNTIIPIGTDRNVYLKNVATHNGTVFAFYASGYRRIGTNA